MRFLSSGACSRAIWHSSARVPSVRNSSSGCPRRFPITACATWCGPGVTGWAQIKYKYGSTVEDAREKLQYDLFYIKNASIGLDLLIMFQTVKTVLLSRGAQ